MHNKYIMIRQQKCSGVYYVSISIQIICTVLMAVWHLGTNFRIETTYHKMEHLQYLLVVDGIELFLKQAKRV